MLLQWLLINLAPRAVMSPEREMQENSRNNMLLTFDFNIQPPDCEVGNSPTYQSKFALSPQLLVKRLLKFLHFAEIENEHNHCWVNKYLKH